MKARTPLAREAAIALPFAVVGWVVSTALFSLTLGVGTLQTALAVRGIMMPIVFVLVALVYFGRTNALPPLLAAVLFATVAAALEIAGPRLLASRSYDALAGVLGTWLPVLFVLIVTWLTGIAARESAGRGKPSSGRT